MNHNQILVIHSRGVYNFMGKIWCHNCVSLFCYNALFSKIGFSFRHIFSAICTNKIPIEFALQDEHKHIAFLIWDIFCGVCSQWGD